ncbi:ABC-type antimicrobial peptide transport system, ATPase component [Beggiatoa alba B18LD]|uniref:ABC-type antimicrobial peptide transport system, ATPase component n=1 Tax=Beggiatoa alba B18LD TaxID=395493 RepID=I3CJ65_9GAMM|nr:ATP-binding cassette domain-containing protein [Beggiatoa alba]EIJ43658.1 ABC-type antimicrobial peptide transport system, ATPase component [Beggiatoa alba B18LD]
MSDNNPNNQQNALTLLLQTKNITIRHKDNILLENVSLDVYQGEIHIITGDIGTGKTSLLNILGLLSELESEDREKSELSVFMPKRINCNRLFVGERDFLIRTYFSYIFQSPELIMNWSAIDNINFFLTATGYLRFNERARRNEAYSLCRSMGITAEIAERPVYTLSGGERQLIDIIRALVKKPKVLIADEPTANLSPELKSEIIFSLIKQIGQEQVSLIVATHDIVTIDLGGLIQLGQSYKLNFKFHRIENKQLKRISIDNYIQVD